MRDRSQYTFSSATFIVSNRLFFFFFFWNLELERLETSSGPVRVDNVTRAIHQGTRSFTKHFTDTQVPAYTNGQTHAHTHSKRQFIKGTSQHSPFLQPQSALLSFDINSEGNSEACKDRMLMSVFRVVSGVLDAWLCPGRWWCRLTIVGCESRAICRSKM